jgi:hypothetical protein
VSRYRRSLRIRRYLAGELVDERELTRDQGLADDDADWAIMASEAGVAWRIVIDDPAGDLPGLVVLQGGYDEPDVALDEDGG